MEEIFRIVPIEGKNLGIVATKFIEKGSLILKEKHQMPRVSLDLEPETFLEQVTTCFEKMSKSDQKEYMKHHDEYEGEVAKKMNVSIQCFMPTGKSIF